MVKEKLGWHWFGNWNLGLCSSQGLKFNSPRCQFRWASLACSKKKKIYFYSELNIENEATFHLCSPMMQK